MTDRRCPRDSQPLIHQVVGAAELDLCGYCSGVWIEPQALEGVKRSGQVWRIPLPDQCPEPPRSVSSEIYCFCGCREPMRPRKASGVAADGSMLKPRQVAAMSILACPGCKAMWLDGGKLHQMVEAAELEESDQRLSVGSICVGFLDDLVLGAASPFLRSLFK